MKIRKIVKSGLQHFMGLFSAFGECCVWYIPCTEITDDFFISSSCQELERVLYMAIFGFRCVWLRRLFFFHWLSLLVNLLPSQWEYSQFSQSNKQVKLLICKCVSFGPLALLIYHQIILQHGKHGCNIGKVLTKLLKPLCFMTYKVFLNCL